MKERIHFESEKENRFLGRQMFWKNDYKGQQILRRASEVEDREKTCMCNQEQK